MKLPGAVLYLSMTIPLAAPAALAADTASIDATMAKIYAAGAGAYEGVTHQRSISQGGDWKTVTSKYTCTVTGPLAMTCQGTDVGEGDWVSKFRVENGIEYQDVTSTNGEPWSRQYVITDAWYTDEKNNGGTRTSTFTASNGVQLESMEDIAVMGNRFVIVSKMRRKGSDDPFAYSMIMDHVMMQ